MSAADQDPLSYSTAESNRFGLRVFRGGEAAALLGKELPAALWRERADIAILRLPSTMMRYVAQLGQLGLPYCVVDGHLTFAHDLTANLPLPRGQEDLVFTPITLSQADDLDRLVDASFDGYLNQYSANPILCDLDWKAGYKEWARTVICPGPPQRRGWIISRNGAPVGFGTFIVECCDVRSMLYGILPSARGAGLYRSMFLHFAAMFQAEGFSTFYNSTQLDNLASQKVWADAGSRVHGSAVTVHLNPLFGRATLVEEFTHEGGAPINLERAFASSDRVRILAASSAGMEHGAAGKLYHGTFPAGSTEQLDMQVVTDRNDTLVATSYLQTDRNA